jgi:hypothetical protein
MVIGLDFVDFDMKDVYLTRLGGMISEGLSFLDNKSGLNLGDSRLFLKWSLVETGLPM